MCLFPQKEIIAIQSSHGQLIVFTLSPSLKENNTYSGERKEVLHGFIRYIKKRKKDYITPCCLPALHMRQHMHGKPDAMDHDGSEVEMEEHHKVFTSFTVSSNILL